MNLAKWIGDKVSKSEAKERLADLPVSPTKRGDKVPFPIADKSAYKSKHSNREINHAITNAKIVTVSLKGLHAIQQSIRGHHVASYIDEPELLPKGARHPAAGTPLDAPVVIQQDGKRYIHDGHHRASAALLSGRDSIRARLVNFDE